MSGRELRRKRRISLICIMVLLSMTACEHKKLKKEGTESDQTQTTPVTSEPAKTEESGADEKKTGPQTPTNELEETSADNLYMQQEQFIQEWSDAFCNRSTYLMTELYAGDDAYQQTYEERYDEMDKMLYTEIPEDWKMKTSDCHYVIDKEKASIWYYVQENVKQAVILRQNIDFVTKNGRIKIGNMQQTIYESIDTKQKYEEAYLADQTPYFFDYYSNLCDLAILKEDASAYQDPGTAAAQTLNLIGGEVKTVVYQDASVDETVSPVMGRDDAAEVTYEFPDGSVTIPMYKTYNGLWLPGADGISMSRSANSDFMLLTKSDYENAIDVRNTDSWYGMEDARLYLFEDYGGIQFYGASEDYLVMVENGEARPYAIAWKSPLMLELKFAKSDYDEDRSEEISCTIHLGTGAGISVDSLYLFDRNEDGKFQSYEYSSQQYLQSLKEWYTYMYNMETDKVQLYVSGRPVAPAFEFKKVVASESGMAEDEITFQDIQAGELISFSIGDTMEMSAILEGFAKDQMVPGCYPAELGANVQYYGKGEFFLDNIRCTSYLGKPVETLENGMKKVKTGASTTCDLDGDGKKEEITYDRINSITDEGYSEPLLTIDGKEYDNDALMALGVYLNHWDEDYWYLTDLDTSDSYQEIALFDAGPSDDPVTFFLRYDGKKLISCGAVSDNPKADSFTVYGDGRVSGRLRLGILQTWWADSEWKLNSNGILEETKPQWYQPYLWSQNGYNTNYLLKDCKLYASPDENAESISLSQGTQIDLTATDDEHWVQITTSDWKVGWMYVEDYDTVRLPEETIKVTDLMSYLCYAD